VNTYLTTH